MSDATDIAARVERGLVAAQQYLDGQIPRDREFVATELIPDGLLALAALQSRVQELEAALRGLKHQYLPYMPKCDCPSCRTIDAALSAAPQLQPPDHGDAHASEVEEGRNV